MAFLIVGNLNGFGTDLSYSPFVAVSNTLTTVKAELAGKALTATVVKSRIARRGVPSTVSPGHIDVRRFDLAISFYDWGYAAQETLITNGVMVPGGVLVNYSLRSNNFAIDATTHADPRNKQVELKGKNVDVDIYSYCRQSIVFDPLTVWNLSSLCAELEDINVNPSTNSQMPQLFAISGILDDAEGPKSAVSMTIDPSHRMFPVEGKMYYGPIVTKWYAKYSHSMGSNYFPDVFTVEVFNGSTAVWSEFYSNIAVEAQEKLGADLVKSGHIVKGSIVDEHRFTRVFSYVEGRRDPTPKELLAMASSDSAILDYQHSALLVSPFRHAGPRVHGRWFVVAAMLILTVSACVFILLAARSHR